MEAGDTWHGALTLGSSPASAGAAGSLASQFWIRIHQVPGSGLPGGRAVARGHGRGLQLDDVELPPTGLAQRHHGAPVERAGR